MCIVSIIHYTKCVAIDNYHVPIHTELMKYNSIPVVKRRYKIWTTEAFEICMLGLSPVWCSKRTNAIQSKTGLNITVSHLIYLEIIIYYGLGRSNKQQFPTRISILNVKHKTWSNEKPDETIQHNNYTCCNYFLVYMNCVAQLWNKFIH